MKNITNISKVGILTILFTLLIYSITFANTIDVDNLLFLYQDGSDSRYTTPSILKDGVIKYNHNPLIDISGDYEFTYLGYEAGSTITFNDSNGVVFTNKTSYNNIPTKKTVNIDTAFFNDLTLGMYNLSIKSNDNLYIYGIFGKDLNTYTNTNWFTNNLYYYIISLNDPYPDSDYDDIIVVFEYKTVPIMSSALLLITGIFSIICVKVKRRFDL
jgi:hypothetical protein